MMIGNIIRNRMDSLGLSLEEFLDKTGFTNELINSIFNNQINLQIDDFETEVIAHVLLCDPSYFFDTQAREKDVIALSCNRGDDTKKSNFAKAKIQKFVMDYLYTKSLL